MMIDEIGEGAGKIWGYLCENGDTTFATLKKNVDLKPDLAALSIGWLAREGKVEIEKKGASVKIHLKN